VTPLQDITTGVLLLAGAVLIAILVFGLTPNLNLGASIIAGAAILILLAGAGYTLQRCGRQWAWRRSRIAQTGGRYLRAWERTAKVFPDH
jgi:hypothetical protein